MANDLEYDVDVETTEEGVHVKITVNDNIDDVTKSVDLGTFPDHEEAATGASAWVKTDIAAFADLGGRRK